MKNDKTTQTAPTGSAGQSSKSLPSLAARLLDFRCQVCGVYLQFPRRGPRAKTCGARCRKRLSRELAAEKLKTV